MSNNEQQSALLDRLKEYGSQSDDNIPLWDTALTLSEISHHGIHRDRYDQHIVQLTKSTTSRFQNLIKADANDDVLTRLAALKHVIADEYGYVGDTETYNDIQNADMMRVIDRRKGLPISLAILVIHIGRNVGWIVEGINFPGHFLVRMTHNNQHVIFDPFHHFKIMQAHDLRALTKQILGPQAELSSTYYDVASSRLILLRLQNNIKARLIDHEEYERALDIVNHMRLFAPDEYRLLFDEAVLRAKLGEAKSATQLLEIYLTKAERDQDRHDARVLLQSLRESLH